MTQVKINDTDTIKKVIDNFEGIQDGGADSNGIPIMIVPADKLVDVMKFLKFEQGYDCFNSLTSAEDDNYYISIYNLYAVLDETFRRICVKVNSPKDNPTVPSVSKIWAGANWYERESYDLMGIIYENHPNLTRILTTDDWVGHTLRRDYKLVEPESYTNILKANEDIHVKAGIERTDIYKNIK